MRLLSPGMGDNTNSRGTMAFNTTLQHRLYLINLMSCKFEELSNSHVSCCTTAVTQRSFWKPTPFFKVSFADMLYVYVLGAGALSGVVFLLLYNSDSWATFSNEQGVRQWFTPHIIMMDMYEPRWVKECSLFGLEAVIHVIPATIDSGKRFFSHICLYLGFTWWHNYCFIGCSCWRNVLVPSDSRKMTFKPFCL